MFHSHTNSKLLQKSLWLQNGLTHVLYIDRTGGTAVHCFADLDFDIIRQEM